MHEKALKFMNNSFKTKYLEPHQESPFIVYRMISMVIFFVVSTGVLKSFVLQLGFYALICITIALFMWIRNDMRLKFDMIHFLILYLTLIALSIAVFQEGQNLQIVVHLLESMICIFALSLLQIQAKDAIYTAFAIMLYVVGKQYYDLGFLSDHGSSFIGLLFIIYLFLIKRKFLAFLLFIPTLLLMTRTTGIALAVFLFLWLIKDKVKLVKRKWLMVGVLAGFVTVLLLLVFYIGVYLAFEPWMILASTMRSLHYGILIDDFFMRGLDVFFPAGNLYAENLLSQTDFTEYVEKGNSFFKYLFYMENQCTHCTYLEWIIDYGLFLGSSVILILIKAANQKTFWVVLCYVMVIGLQCYALSPLMIVPFYVAYYLSNNLGIQMQDRYQMRLKNCN